MTVAAKKNNFGEKSRKPKGFWTFGASKRDLVGVAQWNFQRLGMKYNYKIKNVFLKKRSIFFRNKIRWHFLENFENRNVQPKKCSFLSTKKSSTKKCHRVFVMKKSFRKTTLFFIFLLYLENNPWKVQCTTPTIRAKRNHIPIFRDFYPCWLTLLKYYVPIIYWFFRLLTPQAIFFSSYTSFPSDLAVKKWWFSKGKDSRIRRGLVFLLPC